MMNRSIMKKKHILIFVWCILFCISLAVIPAYAETTPQNYWKKHRSVVAAGSSGFIALKEDGSLHVCMGELFNNFKAFGEVLDWTEIAQIYAYDDVFVGVKTDGTIVATEGAGNIEGWTNIVDIRGSYHHAIGLTSFGTVVASGYNNEGECDVEDWRNIIQIGAGNNYSAGLKADGTVVAVGSNEYGQLQVQDWNDVAQIAVGVDHIVGLLADGTVVATGNNEDGQCNVSSWNNIIQISAGSNHTAGLRADGTVVVATTDDDFSEYSGWKNIEQIISANYHLIAVNNKNKVLVDAYKENIRENVKTWSETADMNQIAGDSESIAWSGKSNDLVDGLYFGGVSEEKELTLLCNGSWSASGPEWLQIEPVSGTGEGELFVQVTSDAPDSADGIIEVFTESGNSSIKMPVILRSTEGVLEFEPAVPGTIIYAGYDHTVAVTQDGTVTTTGNRYNDKVTGPRRWTDIVQVSAHTSGTLGVHSNGSVVYAGSDDDIQESTHHWTDIIQTDSMSYHALGLKKNGRVLTAGSNNHGQGETDEWRDIVQVSAGWFHSIGLRKDGTVVSAGDNTHGECDVNGWRDIVQVSAGSEFTVALRANGTVVATGDNTYGQCNVDNWHDIIQVEAGSDFVIGLKVDGTVIATGNNDKGQCNVQDWSDIIQVSAGSNHTVGAMSNGFTVAVGDNSDGQCATGMLGLLNTDLLKIKVDTAGATGIGEADRMIVYYEMDEETYLPGDEVQVSWERGYSDTYQVDVQYEQADESVKLVQEYIQKESNITFVFPQFIDNGKLVVSVKGYKGEVVSEGKNILEIQVRNCSLPESEIIEGESSEDTLPAEEEEYDPTNNYGEEYLQDIEISGLNIIAGGGHTVLLRPNGTVAAVGNGNVINMDNPEASVNDYVEKWKDIVYISAGYFDVYGIKADGTVVSGIPDQPTDAYAIDGWENIVQVEVSDAPYGAHIVALKEDGTVVAAGNNDDGQCNVEGWTDIVQIAVGQNHTLGLKKDGTVLATGTVTSMQCYVDDWTGIIQIAAGSNLSAGLKADGTVVATGGGTSMYRDGKAEYWTGTEICDWKDIVYVTVAGRRIMGLKKDGSVVVYYHVDGNHDGQCDVGDWTDIVQIAASKNHTVGLRKDGTVLAAGWNNCGECNVENLKLKEYNVVEGTSTEDSAEETNERISECWLEWSDDTYGLIKDLYSEAPGGTGSTIGVRSNLEWTVSTPEWVKAEPANGSGDGSFTIYIDENYGSSRSGEIVVSASGVEPIMMHIQQAGLEQYMQYELLNGEYLDILLRVYSDNSYVEGQTIYLKKGDKVEFIVDKSSMARVFQDGTFTYDYCQMIGAGERDAVYSFVQEEQQRAASAWFYNGGSKFDCVSIEDDRHLKQISENEDQSTYSMVYAVEAIKAGNYPYSIVAYCFPDLSSSGHISSVEGYELEYTLVIKEDEESGYENITLMDYDLSDDSIIWNDHTYHLVDESMTWMQAKEKCESMGGHLVTITTPEEQSAIELLLSASGEKNLYWIGLEKINGSSSWVSGEAFDYANWHEGEPSSSQELYGEIYRLDSSYGRAFKWNDSTNQGNGSSFHTTHSHGYICEFDYITNTDSAVVTDADLNDMNETMAVYDAYNVQIGNGNVYFDKWNDWSYNDSFCIYTDQGQQQISGIGMYADIDASSRTGYADVVYDIPEAAVRFEVTMALEDNWCQTEEYGISTFRILINDQLVEDFVTTNSTNSKKASVILPEGAKKLKLEVYQDWTGNKKGNHACIWGEPTFIFESSDAVKDYSAPDVVGDSKVSLNTATEYRVHAEGAIKYIEYLNGQINGEFVAQDEYTLIPLTFMAKGRFLLQFSAVYADGTESEKSEKLIVTVLESENPEKPTVHLNSEAVYAGENTSFSVQGTPGAVLRMYQNNKVVSDFDQKISADGTLQFDYMFRNQSRIMLQFSTVLNGVESELSDKLPIYVQVSSRGDGDRDYSDLLDGSGTVVAGPGTAINYSSAEKAFIQYLKDSCKLDAKQSYGFENEAMAEQYAIQYILAVRNLDVTSAYKGAEFVGDTSSARASYVNKEIREYLLSANGNYQVFRNLYLNDEKNTFGTRNIIFFFDGCGNNCEEDSKYKRPDYNMASVCVVIRKDEANMPKVVYISHVASTIPCYPVDPSFNIPYNVPTLKDGVYSINTKNHSGQYVSLQVSFSMNDYIRCSAEDTYSIGEAPWPGINIHARSSGDGIVAQGIPNSQGCFNVGFHDYEDYNDFMQVVTGVKSARTSRYPCASSYKENNGKLTEGSDAGLVIVDRKMNTAEMVDLYGKNAAVWLLGTTIEKIEMEISDAGTTENTVTTLNQFEGVDYSILQPEHNSTLVVGSSLILKWKKIDGAQSYQIKLKDTTNEQLCFGEGNDGFIEITNWTEHDGIISLNLTSYVKHVLEVNHSYNVFIRPCAPGYAESSGTYAKFSIVPENVIEYFIDSLSPSNRFTANANSTITVSWKAPADKSYGEFELSGYKVSLQLMKNLSYYDYAEDTLDANATQFVKKLDEWICLDGKTGIEQNQVNEKYRLLITPVLTSNGAEVINYDSATVDLVVYSVGKAPAAPIGLNVEWNERYGMFNLFGEYRSDKPIEVTWKYDADDQKNITKFVIAVVESGYKPDEVKEPVYAEDITDTNLREWSIPADELDPNKSYDITIVAWQTVKGNGYVTERHTASDAITIKVVGKKTQDVVEEPVVDEEDTLTQEQPNQQMIMPVDNAELQYNTSSLGGWGALQAGTKDRWHLGLDITGDAKIKAVADGEVVVIDKTNTAASGRRVVIKHEMIDREGTSMTVYSFYHHLGGIDTNLKKGPITQGTVIGIMGGSGYGKDDYYGVHLHLGFSNQLLSSGNYWGYTSLDNFGLESGTAPIVTGTCNKTSSNHSSSDGCDKFCRKTITNVDDATITLNGVKYTFYNPWLFIDASQFTDFSIDTEVEYTIPNGTSVPSGDVSISDERTELVKAALTMGEGTYNYMYLDMYPEGYWTVGVGHLIKSGDTMYGSSQLEGAKNSLDKELKALGITNGIVEANHPYYGYKVYKISDKAVQALYDADAKKYSDKVDTFLRECRKSAADISDQQYAALVSIAINTPGALSSGCQFGRMLIAKEDWSTWTEQEQIDFVRKLCTWHHTTKMEDGVKYSACVYGLYNRKLNDAYLFFTGKAIHKTNWEKPVWWEKEEKTVGTENTCTHGGNLLGYGTKTNNWFGGDDSTDPLPDWKPKDWLRAIKQSSQHSE